MPADQQGPECTTEPLDAEQLVQRLRAKEPLAASTDESGLRDILSRHSRKIPRGKTLGVGERGWGSVEIRATNRTRKTIPKHSSERISGNFDQNPDMATLAVAFLTKLNCPANPFV